jgi:hypothetical protein
LVNEAALCLCSKRHGRTLTQKGFELANGLPFVTSDQAIHDLLEAHTLEQAQQLQIGLGKLRRASHHFTGTLLALDPHRMHSYSQRQMRRHRFSAEQKPDKMGQTFFLLDCASAQPIAFGLRSSAATVTQATPPLLQMAAPILGVQPPADPKAKDAKPLILADKEHFCQELFQAVRQQGLFDLLCAEPAYPECRRRWARVPDGAFTEHWPGYATAVQPFHFQTEPDVTYYEYVQRNGSRAADRQEQGFLCTTEREQVLTLTQDYPDRWEVEEFFKNNQALGWDRAGTLNLHIRHGHLTMSLLAQAAIHQLRQRLGAPFAQWDAPHLARDFFEGLDGDVRVEKQTIVVTLYHPPNEEVLRTHYANLPQKLAQAGINPEIPWLYNFKLDFRFK